MDYIWGRYSVLLYSVIGSLILIPIVILVPLVTPVLVVAVFLSCVGIFDFFQKSSLLRANFPIVGHMRYFFESFRSNRVPRRCGRKLSVVSIRLISKAKLNRINFTFFFNLSLSLNLRFFCNKLKNKVSNCHLISFL